MARMIDADELKKSLIGVDIESDMDVVFADTYDETNLFEIIDEAPTIDTVKQEWIRAKDRLPKKDEEVLVYWDDGFEIGRYVGGEVGDDVYWMPLPEPPEKEK